VINASWGLGEAIVAGSVTPDEFRVGLATLRVKEKTLGKKALRTIRDPRSGVGTITEEVPHADRARLCLSDAEASALTRLGRLVMEY
jgi:pyruvate,water dikinase